MSDDAQVSVAAPRDGALPALGSSTLLSLLEAMIQLNERNQREHKLFAQDLKGVRNDLEGKFNTFAAETQKAYQQLRKEIHGEKRVSLDLLNELLELGQDLEQIVAAKPRVGDNLTAEEVQALARWADSVEVESRKLQASLARHGIYPYDAVVGSSYNPALHERIGTRRVEGLGPLLVAEQQQRGYASQQPEFVLRRPKVFVSE